jgi:general stress protein YciG
MHYRFWKGGETNMDNQNANAKSNKGNTSNRGFASMSRDQIARIASKGGKAAHRSGKAHQFTSEEAREAGRKGGRASQSNRQQ